MFVNNMLLPSGEEQEPVPGRTAYFAREVLQHRVLLNYDGQAEEVAVASLVDELVSQTPEEG